MAKKSIDSKSIWQTPEKQFEAPRARRALIIISSVYIILLLLTFTSFRPEYHFTTLQIVGRIVSFGFKWAIMLSINQFIIRKYILVKVKWNIFNSLIWFLWNATSIGAFTVLCDMVFNPEFVGTSTLVINRIVQNIFMFAVPYSVAYFFSVMVDARKQAEISTKTISINSSKTGIRLRGKNKTEILFLHYENLLYLESKGNYVSVAYMDDHKQVKRCMFRATMKEMERQLSNERVSKIQRSFIIADEQIEKFERQKGKLFVILKVNNIKLPVSVTYFEKFMEQQASDSSTDRKSYSINE